ncbi:MAG: tyrosine-type recombinase/integrase, partial [Candidatus Micrarchaeaceae archaeon]
MRSGNGAVTSLMNKITSNSGISKENKALAGEMLAFMQASGAKTNTVIKHLYCFEKYIGAIGSDVDAKNATRGEIEKAMAKIETYELSHETKRNIKVVVKSFYKHFVGEDLYYPKQIAWIKTTVNKNKKILPEDILNEDEVLQLLDAATNVRDRAIIALLFDTGIRAGELLALRKKDLDMEGNPAHVTVMGKTGSRRIPIMFSVPFLGNWIGMRK